MNHLHIYPKNIYIDVYKTCIPGLKVPKLSLNKEEKAGSVSPRAQVFFLVSGSNYILTTCRNTIQSSSDQILLVKILHYHQKYKSTNTRPLHLMQFIQFTKICSKAQSRRGSITIIRSFTGSPSIL